MEAALCKENGQRNAHHDLPRTIPKTPNHISV